MGYARRGEVGWQVIVMTVIAPGQWLQRYGGCCSVIRGGPSWHRPFSSRDMGVHLTAMAVI